MSTRYPFRLRTHGRIQHSTKSHCMPCAGGGPAAEHHPSVSSSGSQEALVDRHDKARRRAETAQAPDSFWPTCGFNRTSAVGQRQLLLTRSKPRKREGPPAKPGQCCTAASHISEFRPYRALPGILRVARARASISCVTTCSEARVAIGNRRISLLSLWLRMEDS